MEKINKLFVLAALGLAIALLQGCTAGGASGRSGSLFDSGGGAPIVVAEDLSQTEADALVVIRYPASVDAGVKDRFVRALRSS